MNSNPSSVPPRVITVTRRGHFSHFAHRGIKGAGSRGDNPSRLTPALTRRRLAAPRFADAASASPRAVAPACPRAVASSPPPRPLGPQREERGPPPQLLRVPVAWRNGGCSSSICSTLFPSPASGSWQLRIQCPSRVLRDARSTVAFYITRGPWPVLCRLQLWPPSPLH